MLSFLTKQADELTGPIEAVGNVLDALFTSDKERLQKKRRIGAHRPAADTGAGRNQ